MKVIGSVVSLLLVLVMLGSVVSPALATNVRQKVPACPSRSKLTVKKPKVVVVEINGIEKNEILAKALKDKNSRILENFMKNRGYRSELLKSKVR